MFSEKYFSNESGRRSIRLKDFDYSQSGWYYVTICTKNMSFLFGEVRNSRMYLNDLGEIVDAEWNKTKLIRPNVDLDYYVIMPNHLHGIIIIDNSINCRGVTQYAPTENKFHSPSLTLGAIIRGFKSVVTKRINVLQNTPNKPVWQRNYYERIIRNEKELFGIRKYILQNPLKWEIEKGIPENLNFI